MPLLANSKIFFIGSNNILFCEEGVVITNSEIKFNGNNSLIYLSKNRHKYYLSVSINHNSVLYMGRDNYLNGVLHIILSERKHFFVGSGCLFSFGIWVRNADPHLVYSCKSCKRINHTKSIYIGDHVWIGQSAFILKGTEIDSGSIVGAMSVVSGKKIGNNSTWVGNPVKKIADMVFWDGSCVHLFDENMTDMSLDYNNYVKHDDTKSADSHTYSYNPDEEIAYHDIDVILEGDNVIKKLDYLISLSSNVSKNRFVHSDLDNK